MADDALQDLGNGGQHPLGNASHGWGLPTHLCPATPYLLHEYPKLHRQWLAEGRYLVHCSTSGGFGDYLHSIPSVLVLSMLTELALVLRCDVPTFDPSNPQREQRLHEYLPHVFTGPHIDWTPRVQLSGPREQYVRPIPRPSGTAGATNWTSSAGYMVLPSLQAHQMMRYSRSPVSMRVYSNGFTHARRLIKFNMGALRTKLGFYAEHANDVDMDSCFLRYLFSPTDYLTRAVDHVLQTTRSSRLSSSLGAAASSLTTGDSTLASIAGSIKAATPNVAHPMMQMPRSGTSLAPYVATHIRVGDSVFRNSEWTAQHMWSRSQEYRNSTFLSNVPASLRALMRASEVSIETGSESIARRVASDGEQVSPRATAAPAVASTASPSAAVSAASRTTCLPCVIVSDSPLVESCAVAALHAPIITPGAAVHLLASSSAQASDETNIMKIFIDWWLLARAQISVELGAASAFSTSAMGFKKASSARAVVIKPDITSVSPQTPSL